MRGDLVWGGWDEKKEVAVGFEKVLEGMGVDC